MEFYQIADLEKLTGIKAHTIRIWEKRYNLIIPQRTTTNIRLYDDEQLKKLLNVATLMAFGFKISKIAALKSSEIHQLILEKNNTQTNNATITAYINELTLAMMIFNEPDFEKTISNSIIKFGLFDAMLTIIYPFLHQTGLLWSLNNTMPIQEHFASCIIKRKLISAIDALPAAAKPNKKFLLLLPQNEWHELGLLFSNYIIKSKGYQTIYLGANVPFNNIETAITLIKPTHLFMIIFSNLSLDILNQKTLFAKLKSTKTNLLLSGHIEKLLPFENKQRITILKQPTDLLKILEF